MGEHRGSTEGARGRSTGAGEPELATSFPAIAAHIIHNSIREHRCLA